MKSIQSILVLFVAVLLMSTTTYAQRPNAPRTDRGNKMVEMMAKELDLSDTQAEQIKVIHEGFSEKMRSMRGQANGDKTAMREEMQKVVEEREIAINNVLNEEQRTKLAAMKADRSNRSGMAERPARPDGKRPTMNGKRPNIDGSKPARGMRGKKGGKLQKELGLSDTQENELKKLTKAHKAKMKDLKASGKKRKVKKANKKYRAAVEKLLTPEQYEKWATMKSERKVRKDILK